ncbi:MAG: MBL fold metallo-hydrolase, partial [Acidobacteria bacterium]
MSLRKRLQGPSWPSMVMALALIAGVSAQSPAVVGQPLGPWTPGTLEIHQISTGRGNAAFSILPDGKTLLFDAGEAGAIKYADEMPNDTQTPGEWIVRYITRAMAGRDPVIDFAVISHFHVDHMGAIAHVGAAIPVRALIDRGDAYATPPATDQVYAGYRAFAEAMKSRGTRRETARAGSADQVTSSTPGFSVRVISVNDQIWTGAGNRSATRFPPLASVAADDRPTENMCSVTLRMSYGKFDYFTGGDMPGYPNPGGPAWHDLESAVARVIGPTDALVINHHGSIESANPTFLSTLKPRVMIVPAWSPTHPSPDVLKRMLATKVYPDPRDIFVVALREPTKATIGARASQVASDHGHVVIRVEPGGDRYWVIVLDDTKELPVVRSVHGPYAAQ